MNEIWSVIDANRKVIGKSKRATVQPRKLKEEGNMKRKVQMVQKWKCDCCKQQDLLDESEDENVNLPTMRPSCENPPSR